MKNFNYIGHSVDKIDSLALACGEERFTEDFPIASPLHVSILHSPYPHALINNIDTSEAEKITGVALILTHKNTPARFFTTAGQGYPEPSPYDSRLFPKKVRFVGDCVAAAAAETKEAADLAVSKIKVDYKNLEAIFDMEKSMDEKTVKLHDKDAHVLLPVEYDPEKNLAAGVHIKNGDIEKGFAESDFVLEKTFKTHYASHCAIEPHAVAAYFDERGRLVLISTTQVPFHARRIVSKILEIPIRQIRVIKPRIGGGFGGKQEVLLEPLVALIAHRTRRSVKMILSRKEVFISSRTRHEMRIRYKIGYMKDGTLNALSMIGLMNAGAYGSHALTVLSNAGSKVLPLFNKIKHVEFNGKTVYTNLPVGGAYRGYGATQGYFGLNVLLDIIALETRQDLLELIKRQHIRENESSFIFKALGEGKEGVDQFLRSCMLDECITLGAKAIGWYEKRGKKIQSDDFTFRGVGLAVAMQGSGIPRVDMGAASMKMNEDGSFNLYLGATDIGTGSDTIMAQIVAETLNTDVENIIVLSSDTDLTPFDTGAYASSTTYISGKAVEKCALKIKDQLFTAGADMLKTTEDDIVLEKAKVCSNKTGKSVTFEEIGYYTFYTNNQFQIQSSASNFAEESPPPFIAQFAEVEVNASTGHVRVIKMVSAADCGQPLNPKLVEGQIEGAAINGISYALTEEYLFDENGKMTNPDFGNYKIFTAADIPEIETIIVPSYEESGPYGAKSIAEIGINGPIPAIANAIYDAVGVRLYETPFTSEKIYNALKAMENKAN